MVHALQMLPAPASLVRLSWNAIAAQLAVYSEWYSVELMPPLISADNHGSNTLVRQKLHQDRVLLPPINDMCS